MAENRCVCCGEIVPEGRQVCPTCEARASAPKYDPAEFFSAERKRMTNAMRIRAMSDEEIAEWLAKITDCGECHVATSICLASEKLCASAWLDWLKQEVET